MCSRKQRHTARRIWQRLKVECDLDVSESTVEKYVRRLKQQVSGFQEEYLELEWSPGEAQVDFGEADFDLQGLRTRLSYFVVSFPYSNMGFAQLFPAETAECVCEGLTRIFEHIGGVPNRIVFDNATGVGRRIGEEIRTTELFRRCACHYDFDYSFCNPYSGHEKGNVENKVGTIRRNLFVPVPRIWNLDSYNAKLLAKCSELSDKAHYKKNTCEADLFCEDKAALIGLPKARFACVRDVVVKANKCGAIKVDGPHYYSVDPKYNRCSLIARLGAYTVEIYDEKGSFICSHPRSFGSCPTNTKNPATQLNYLCSKSGAWRNSQVRASLPQELREHLDSLSSESLKENLRILRDSNASFGWDAMVGAAKSCFESTGRLDGAAMESICARQLSGSIEYEEKEDLSIYDHKVRVAHE